jgi:hypothetical protein
MNSPMPSSGRPRTPDARPAAARDRAAADVGPRLADELPQRLGVLGDDVTAEDLGFLGHDLIPSASATAWEAFTRPKP